MHLTGRQKQTNFLSYSVPYQSDGVSNNILFTCHCFARTVDISRKLERQCEAPPRHNMADIYSYLINMASLYTNKNFKGYKFLEAYNFFVSGHVHNVAYHGINNLSELCFIKTKVIIKGLSLQVKMFRFFEKFSFNASKLSYTYIGSNIFCVYSYLFLHSIRPIW